jgi:flagellar protein FlaG
MPHDGPMRAFRAMTAIEAFEKVVHMFNEIQTTQSPLSVGIKSTGPKVEAAVGAAEALQPIAKPVIKVDTERMRQDLSEAIQHLNEVMRDGGRNINFSIDNALETPIVLVKNAQTGEVVRQIPNEVIVRMAHSIEDFKGMLHNTVI